MSFLGLENKTIVVFGVANRKSVAYFIARTLEAEGANVVYVVQNERIRDILSGKLLRDREILTCDVESSDEISALAQEIQHRHGTVFGIVHSIAFADFSGGIRPFHETTRRQFLQAMQVSCFSFVEIGNAMRDILDPDGAMVTISISATRMAAESYSFMGPVKAALDSAVAFLAKSFSRFSNVRVNAVKAGPLKTSASAGIPGYIDYYLFTEQATLRKKPVQTQEVADTAVFLLSPRSAGINAQGVVVDAGMEVNYFDEDIIRKVARGE